MSDILHRDLADLDERLRSILNIVNRAQHGSLHELRRLKTHVLGGSHCAAFLFIDLTPTIHTAINEAVCGVDHKRIAKELS